MVEKLMATWWMFEEEDQMDYGFKMNAYYMGKTGNNKKKKEKSNPIAHTKIKHSCYFVVRDLTG